MGVVHRFNQPHLPLFRTYLKQKLNAVLFGEKYDTKYVPEEEKEEQKEAEQIDSFLEDESEENEESELNETDETVEESNDERQEIDEKFDGYDTDELKDLLNDMQTNEPQTKKRK